MTAQIFQLIGIAFVTAVAAILVKSTKPELAVVITIAGSIILLLFVLEVFRGTITLFSDIAEATGLNAAIVKTLLKMVGIGYLVEFSAGILSDGTFDYERYIPGVMEDPERINRELALLWIACGTKDPRHAGHLDTVDELHRRGVRCEFHDAPWGHEWQFWRLQLYGFAQRLFRNNH